MHAASEAGALMKAKIGADVLKTKFNPKDLLTEVDAECQRAIEKVHGPAQILQSTGDSVLNSRAVYCTSFRRSVCTDK